LVELAVNATSFSSLKKEVEIRTVGVKCEVCLRGLHIDTEMVLYKGDRKKDKMINFVPLESPCDSEQDRRIPDFPSPFYDSFPKITSGKKGFFLEPVSRISLVKNEKKKELKKDQRYLKSKEVNLSTNKADESS
jgi:hypothetical protein